MTLAEIANLASMFGAVLGLVLAAAVLSRRDGDLASRLLGCLLAAGAVAGGAIALSHARWTTVELDPAVEMVAVLLSAPLLYLNVRARLEPGLTLGPRAWHFLPAAALAVWSATWAMARRLVPGWSAEPWAPPMASLVAYALVYTALAAAAVVRDRGRRRTDVPGLKPVTVLLAGMALVHVAQLVRMASVGDPRWRDVVALALAANMLIWAFLGFRESSLGEVARSRRRRSALRADGRAGELLPRVDQLLRAERSFLNGDLAVADLAGRLAVPAAQLSAALSQAGTNFSELVNRHRVEEARQLLVDPLLRHLTVDAIGSRAGFRSRSVFYAAFKQRTGMSPAEFRQAASGR